MWKNRLVWKRWRLGVFSLILIWLGGGWLSWANKPVVPVSTNAWKSLAFLKRNLNAAGVRQAKAAVGRAFTVVALSKAAQGLSILSRLSSTHKRQAQSLLKQSLNLALQPGLSPYRKAPRKVRRFRNEGLYLSHLAIILGEARATLSIKQHDGLHKRIILHLRKMSLGSPTKHMRSYSTSRHRWPADQTATLYALWLYDKIHRSTYSHRPIKEWLAYMKKSATNKRGLHLSNVTGSRLGKHPRGCGLSWSILYMGRFAPGEARALFRRYKQHHFVQVAGLGGFREWPKGVKGFIDNDTGPIIMGIGAAATAFGIGAARLVGDQATVRALQRTRAFVQLSLPLIDKKRRRKVENLLTHGITLLTDTIQPMRHTK